MLSDQRGSYYRASSAEGISRTLKSSEDPYIVDPLGHLLKSCTFHSIPTRHLVTFHQFLHLLLLIKNFPVLVFLFCFVSGGEGH